MLRAPSTHNLVLRRKADNAIVAHEILKASSFLTRLVGLLGHSELRDELGIWLLPCKSVHTFAMRFAIDVVFLDRTLRVMRIAANTPAWRLCLAPRGTYSVIELKAGRAAALDLQAGDRLVVADTNQDVELDQIKDTRDE